MSQPMLQYRFTTGRPLWLVIALALGLALGTQAAAAKECHRETPLPADVRLIAPGPEVPEAVARFAGVWIGAWLDQGHPGRCATRWSSRRCSPTAMPGSSSAMAPRRPGTSICRGSCASPAGSSTGYSAFTYRYRSAPSSPIGWPARRCRAPSRAKATCSLTRVADVRQVGCGSQTGGLPPAPPAAGPRDRLTAAELLGAGRGGHRPRPQRLLHARRPGRAGPARLQGTLTVAGPDACSGRAMAAPAWPRPCLGFSVAFFTQGEHLVPVVRDILAPASTSSSPRAGCGRSPAMGACPAPRFPLC